MLLILLCFVCVWLPISAALYTLLWFAFLRRTGPIATGVFNLCASAILSPGMVGGHGALPFPGGLAFLFGSHGPGDSGALTLNFAMWMLTLLAFFMLDRVLKARRARRT